MRNACGVCTDTSSSRGIVSRTTSSYDSLDRIRHRNGHNGRAKFLVPPRPRDRTARQLPAAGRHRELQRRWPEERQRVFRRGQSPAVACLPVPASPVWSNRKDRSATCCRRLGMLSADQHDLIDRRSLRGRRKRPPGHGDALREREAFSGVPKPLTRPRSNDDRCGGHTCAMPVRARTAFAAVRRRSTVSGGTRTPPRSTVLTPSPW